MEIFSDNNPNFCEFVGLKTFHFLKRHLIQIFSYLFLTCYWNWDDILISYLLLPLAIISTVVVVLEALLFLPISLSPILLVSMCPANLGDFLLLFPWHNNKNPQGHKDTGRNKNAVVTVIVFLKAHASSVFSTCFRFVPSMERTYRIKQAKTDLLLLLLL